MPYPRKVTDAHLERIEQEARVRLTRKPDKVIAYEMGIPIKTFQRWLTRMKRKVISERSMRNTESLPVSDVEIERLRSLG